MSLSRRSSASRYSVTRTTPRPNSPLRSICCAARTSRPPILPGRRDDADHNVARRDCHERLASGEVTDRWPDRTLPDGWARPPGAVTAWLGGSHRELGSGAGRSAPVLHGDRLRSAWLRPEQLAFLDLGFCGLRTPDPESHAAPEAGSTAPDRPFLRRASVHSAGRERSRTSRQTGVDLQCRCPDAASSGHPVETDSGAVGKMACSPW